MDSLEWENDPNYNIGLNIVNNLAVNDSTERAVKLVQEFNCNHSTAIWTCNIQYPFLINF